tara:strand:+ start:290399 stop:290809 length:411 start_codon:yes stop_codon:yes gene_type:complete
MRESSKLRWDQQSAQLFSKTHVRGWKKSAAAGKAELAAMLRKIGSIVFFDSVAQVLTGVPDDAVVWSTSDRTYTTKHMRDHLSRRDDTAKQFASELLAVSRQVIMNSIEKHEEKAAAKLDDVPSVATEEPEQESVI